MARRLALAFAVLFLFAAAVQYNDPDPLAWMAIYLAAAGSCLVTARARTGWQLAAGTAAVALVWALTLAPTAWSVPPLQLLAGWEMRDERVEVAREMYGLLLVFAACVALARQQWSAGRAAELKPPAGAPSP